MSSPRSLTPPAPECEKQAAYRERRRAWTLPKITDNNGETRAERAARAAAAERAAVPT